jgi:hypothetical protein
MASPVAVRQPLAQKTINTGYYPPTTSITATVTARTTFKPLAGQKRAHSQINGQENSNIQQQILSAAAFKSPLFPLSRQNQTTLLQPHPPSKRTLVHVKPADPGHSQSQPKQQPDNSVIITSRQRQQTHNTTVRGDDEEMVEWRKSMRRTLSSSTFYFDGLEETFKEQATRWLNRYGGVTPFPLVRKLICL